VSIQAFSLTVPAEQRADFLERARLVAERALEGRSSELELELSLSVLSVLCGAACTGQDHDS
jgi:hypothetical protein